MLVGFEEYDHDDGDTANKMSYPDESSAATGHADKIKKKHNIRNLKRRTQKRAKREDKLKEKGKEM